MNLGVHVSGAGKIYETLERAHALGCTTMQIFSHSPQQWQGKPLDEADVREFISRRLRLKINPVFIHISYLINLASPDKRLYAGSIAAYIRDMREAKRLKADYIVTHMGSHRDTSEEEGIKRLINALNRILDETSGSNVKILLENTAGSGSWLGYKFKHQQRIIAGIKDKSRVSLCLDTAHAYLAGYDLSSADGLGSMLNEIKKLLGLKLIRLIHLNDARGSLASHNDRHDHIGKGHIGMEGMRRIINHPSLKNIPMILETPKDTSLSDAENLKTVRKLAKKD
jgi:deoxyribonuclease-4